MSIIEKKTLKEKVKIKNYGSLSIYKRDRSPFWWVSFYVSKSYINDKSGFFRQSSKLTNQREAERKAKEISESNVIKKTNKLAAYLIGKGFESELVWDLLRAGSKK